MSVSDCSETDAVVGASDGILTLHIQQKVASNLELCF